MATKKAAAKSETVVRPIKETLTKAKLVELLAEKLEFSRKDVTRFFAELEAVMAGSVHPKGSGEFILPGLFKIKLQKVPARKAGTLIRNPATGEMMKAAAKPATVRVKIRPLARLKAAATIA